MCKHPPHFPDGLLEALEKLLHDSLITISATDQGPLHQRDICRHQCNDVMDAMSMSSLTRRQPVKVSVAPSAKTVTRRALGGKIGTTWMLLLLTTDIPVYGIKIVQCSMGSIFDFLGTEKSYPRLNQLSLILLKELTSSLKVLILDYKKFS